MRDTPDPGDGPLAAVRWFLRTDDKTAVFVREFVSGTLTVALVGMLLFAVSGVWPPLIAVESDSMQPQIERGDLVFVMEEHRFAPATDYNDTGVVTYRIGRQTGYSQFHNPGDVIVYEPDGNPRATPVIHRPMFWVNDSENWYDKANKSYLAGASNCAQLRNCPAPHAGFITKGGHNGYYDQAKTISSPVKPTWVHGTAEFHIPWLGWVRLVITGEASLEDAF